jgi:DNA-binding response OmpR family regulator
VREQIVAVKVILIDNDTTLMERIRPILELEGYGVTSAVPGPDAIRKTAVEDVGLVILGIASREEDWAFCRRLLSFVESPLLLLLSSDDELDRARALDLGADDCMIKPARLVELVARVRALLRRHAMATPRRQQSFFVDGNLVVDLTRREVRLDDEPVALTPTEFRLLACFVRHAGQVLAHERLSMQVWGPAQAVRRDTLKQCVHHLRRKLEVDPSRPQRIVTRWGEGYLFQPVAGEGRPGAGERVDGSEGRIQQAVGEVGSHGGQDADGRR